MESRNIKILAIDDNQDNLTSIKALIKDAFPQAVTLMALNGTKGFELAAAEDPDVILLDIVMPGMDGFEVCKKLKADNKLCDIPVVFVTAIKGDKENRIRALEAGAEAFLAKPVEITELTAQVRAMAKIKHANIAKRDEKDRLTSLVEEQTQELKKKHIATLKLLEDLKLENEIRKNSEAALSENEERYRTLLLHLEAGIVVHSPDTSIVMNNPRASELLGLSNDQMKGKAAIDPAWKFVNEKNSPLVFEDYPVNRILTTKKPILNKIMGIHQPNTNDIVWVTVNGYPVMNNKGEIAEIVISFIDITKRKKAEEALIKSREVMKSMEKAAQIGGWEFDVATMSQTWTDEVFRILEIDLTNGAPDVPEGIGFIAQEFQPMAMLGIQRAIEHGEPYNQEWEVITTKGNKRWVNAIATPFLENGKTKSVAGSFQDITKRKKAEDALIRSEKELKNVQQITHVGSWYLDVATNQVVWTEELYKMYGFDPALPPPPYSEHQKLFTPESWAMLSSSLAKTRETGIPYELELKTVRKDGSNGWIWVRGETVLNEDKTVGLWGAAQDITEHKRLGELLSKQNSMFTSLLENLRIGVYMIEVPSGKPLLANEASFNILGRGILPEANSNTIARTYDLYLRGSNIPYSNDDLPLVVAMRGVSKYVDDMDVVKPDGTRTAVEVFGSPVRDEKGNIWASLVSFQDITARKSAENEIRLLNETLEQRVADRTNQLASINKELAFHLSELEQFTYVSNHDLREPLRTLTQFTKLFYEKYAGKLDEEGEKYIEFISKSAVRMSALVGDLFDYSILGKESVKTIVDCNKIVDAVLSDLDDSIKGSHAKISFQKLPIVNGYETEVRLLFQNLIGNAIKYQKKDIVPEINILVESREKEWLFSIMDNGIGIDQKHFEKIFIIFQRLHNRNEFEGTGIGLAQCKKIVELHGGKIWVESTPGAGSTFMFTILKNKHL